MSDYTIELRRHTSMTGARFDEVLAAHDAQVRAEAWEEGYTSGHSNAMRRMSDEPDAPTTPNPYRTEVTS